jgi:hypothetical protein
MTRCEIHMDYVCTIFHTAYVEDMCYIVTSGLPDLPLQCALFGPMETAPRRRRTRAEPTAYV